MGKRLTEDMVASRTKISDLSKVKRLNYWGSELEDVSLLHRMPYVEVLSLSVNKINSLADFQYCKRLEELYIRQNNIRDVNEVMYLQNLTNLKNLWLDENPCAHIDGYRLAVIKALPQLQKLDNVTITREEFQEAQRKGKNLYYPNDEQDESEEEYVAVTVPRRTATPLDSEPDDSPRQSPIRQETTEYELESEEIYPREDVSEGSREYSPPREPTPPRRVEQVRRSYSPEPEYVDRRNSYERQSPRQQYYEEYTNGERYAASIPGSEPIIHSQDKTNRFTCPAAAHRPPFNRRPVTRNSNILSAVLCLVKELDYPSLEVVEMAVRCRMDELDE